MVSKYYNTKPIYKGVKFASRFELECYLILEKYFSQNKVLLQHPIELKPPCKNFKSINMVVDFAIRDDNNHIYAYIEAKGYPKDDWWLKLKILEYTNPIVFNNYYIVHSGLNFVKRNVPSDLNKRLFSVNSLDKLCGDLLCKHPKLRSFY